MRSETRTLGMGLRLVSSIALAVGLGGCAASRHDVTPDPPSGRSPETVPALLASVDLRLPLDRYLMSPREVRRYGTANRELIRDCLLRHGVTAPLPHVSDRVGPRTWTERRYGLTDATAAAHLGFGLGDRTPTPRRGTRSTRLSAAALAALDGQGRLAQELGVPPDGCSGEATRRLGPSTDDQVPAVDPFLAQALSLQSFDQSRHDPRVRSVIDLWSRCMRSRGHDFDDPFAPFADPSLQRPTARARRTALDDVACKRRSNLVGVWFTVETGYQERAIESRAEDLGRLAEINAAIARKVTVVLNGSR